MAFTANLASVNCSLLTFDPLCSSEMGLLAEIITFCGTGSPDVAQVHTRGSKHKVLLLWILLTIVLLTQRTIFHLDSDWAKLACRRAAVTHLHIHLIPAACFAAERPGCVCDAYVCRSVSWWEAARAGAPSAPWAQHHYVVQQNRACHTRRNHSEYYRTN